MRPHLGSTKMVVIAEFYCNFSTHHIASVETVFGVFQLSTYIINRKPLFFRTTKEYGQCF